MSASATHRTMVGIALDVQAPHIVVAVGRAREHILCDVVQVGPFLPELRLRTHSEGFRQKKLSGGV